MITYNVTINIEESVNDAWVTYMKEEHIPDVMKTGCFETFTMNKIITRQPDEEGTTYAIQYRCKNMSDYENYQNNHAPALQKDHTEKFGGKFVAFRTLLEEV